MARVYPGSDFQDVYDARNIYTSNFGGDDYKVRRSANDQNLDPRANSEWQQKIIDNFSLASRIWNNKKDCWKDHFKRSTKEFRYGNQWDTPVYKVLTGYKLAINMLLASLSANPNKFYDPLCFCVTPCDMFGDPMPSFSRLEIQYEKPVNYLYDEKKQTYDFYKGGEENLDRFCSATLPQFDQYYKCLLSTEYCIPRDNRATMDYRAIDMVNKIVQWPSFFFDPVDDQIHQGFGLWDTENFSYRKLREDELFPDNRNIRGAEIVMTWAPHTNDLCCRNNFKMMLYYGPYYFQCVVTHTGTAPFLDMYLGDSMVGRVGIGCGSSRSFSVSNRDNFLENPPLRKLNWKQSPYPVVSGYQPTMYPAGKLTELRLVDIEWGPQNPDLCMFNHINQTFLSPEPIHFNMEERTPLIKLNAHSIRFNDHYMGQWWVHGAIWPHAITEDGHWWPLVLSGGPIALSPGQSEYCLTNWLFNGEAIGIGLHIRGTPGPHVGSAVASYIGDPMCLSDTDPCRFKCPYVGQRGVFVVERFKEFEVKPVACRCPEEFCPDCSKLPHCPDDDILFKVGSDCLPCIGPTNRGLVYDYLK